jgi:hypothetical protein
MMDGFIYYGEHQLGQMGFTKMRQGSVVRMGIGGEVTKRHRIIAGPLDLAAGKHPGGVAVHQQPQQYRRMMCRRAAPRVLARQGRQIQLSITSTMKRARWFSGSQSSTDGGKR